jgi:ornithine carbamoyltransferase
MVSKRDLIKMIDLQEDLREVIDLAIKIKAKKHSPELMAALQNKSLAMIFEKPSTRTRVSFEVAMSQLGGHALYLSPRDLQMGRGETISDTAKVLSRYVDIIMYRGFKHEITQELASSATIPVINGLDDLEHPCQTLADLMTIREHKGDYQNLKLAYVGDGNNVCNSLAIGAALVGMDMSIGCPEGYEPDNEILRKAQEIAEGTDAKIIITQSASEAVENADVIYTDVWVSMGDEKEKAERQETLQPFQVNTELVSKAKSDCIVLHCLPAHRGDEITDDVMDSEQSAVFDQAENRLHTEKAVILKLLDVKI